MNIQQSADRFSDSRALHLDRDISPEAIRIMNSVKEFFGGAAPSESIEKLPY